MKAISAVVAAGVGSWVLLLLFARESSAFSDREFQWRSSSVGTLGRPMRGNHTEILHRATNFFREVEATEGQFAFWDTASVRGEGHLLEHPHLRILTANSAEYFDDSMQMIHSVLGCHPEIKIEYYDIGLRRDQVQRLKEETGVVYKDFDFDSYPAELRSLREFRYKPLVVYHATKQWWNEGHEDPAAIWWMDASIRLDCSIQNETDTFRVRMENLERRLRLTSFVFAGVSMPHSNLAATGPGQFDYLPVHHECKTARQHSSSSMIFNLSPSGILDVLQWWLFCSLTSDCFHPKDVPPGRRLRRTCVVKPWSWFEFSGCLKGGQSALNLIVGDLNDCFSNLYFLDAPVIVRPGAAKTVLGRLRP
eukprot:Polyplicarium_translucidae@DN1429_c0_g1_i1.p1